MAVRKSRRRRRRSSDAPPWLVERLVSGHDFAFLEGRDLEISREALRAAWERLGPAITGDWIREQPGTRPWAWWEFEAAEPRRQISGGPPREGDGLWFGLPPCWGLEQFAVPPLWETEGEYLARLKLLARSETPTEATALDRGIYAEALTRSDQVALERGYYFDHRPASHVERFFVGFLRHSHKPWAGRPFIPQPWQRDRILRPAFGWRTRDGLRRHRKLFIFIPKKNGKSVLSCGLILYLLSDEEPAAEVYGTATSLEQSGRLYDECTRMLAKSEHLSQACRAVRSLRKIFCEDSYFLTLSGDSAGESEGANAYGLVQDELHKYNSPQLRQLWSSLYYSDEARQDATHIVITTAGDDDPDQIWIEEYAYAKQVARGEIVDLERLVFLAEAEEGDDWLDPAVWQKANPGWGVTINPERFAARAQEATTNNRKRRDFLRYRLNRPVGALSSWLPEELWDSCAARPSFPPGCTVFGGLDLSARSDFTALVFTRREHADRAAGEELGDDEYPEDRYHVWPMLFLPEATIDRRAAEGSLLYRKWADEGWIHVVPGPVIREGFVIDRVLEVAEYCDLHELGYDEWNALEEAMKLNADHGITMVPLRQGYRTLSPPMKKLERLLLLGKLVHGGHPVLKWMFQNVQIVSDENGNIRPVKAAKHSPKKIDGIVALVMAIARAMLWVEERSVYETRGVISF